MEIIKKIGRRVYRNYAKLTLGQPFVIARKKPVRRFGNYILDPSYDIISMGNIYRAIDRKRSGDYVIVKTVTPGIDRDVWVKIKNNPPEKKISGSRTSEIMRLYQTYISYKNEFEVLRNLKHRNIVRSIDKGTVDLWFYHGFPIKKCVVPYFTYELVDGLPLRDFYSDDEEKWLLDSKSKAIVSLELCKVIQFIHEQGYAHLDLSLSNIMVMQQGGIKLIDFESATAHGKQPLLSQYGIRLYTLSSASPEQILHHHEIGFKSDYYSLCAIIFYLYTDSNFRSKLTEANAYNLDFAKFKDQFPSNLAEHLESGTRFDVEERELDLAGIIEDLLGVVGKMEP